MPCYPCHQINMGNASQNRLPSHLGAEVDAVGGWAVQQLADLAAQLVRLVRLCGAGAGWVGGWGLGSADMVGSPGEQSWVVYQARWGHAGRETGSQVTSQPPSHPPPAHLAHSVAAVVGLDAGGCGMQRPSLLRQHALQLGVHLGAHTRRQLAALLLLLPLVGRAARCRAIAAAIVCRLLLLRLFCCGGRLLLRLALLGRAQRHGVPAARVQVELVQLVEQLAEQAVALRDMGGGGAGAGRLYTQISGWLCLAWHGMA